MSELNPNHPVTQEVHDHWHKIVGILMLKIGVAEIEITESDVIALGDNEKAVVFDTSNNKCFVRMVSMEEGERLARKEGGLPI
jgi:hypothetical protein